MALVQAASDVAEQGAVDDRDTFLHGVRDLLSIYSNAEAGLSTYVSVPGIVQQLSSLQSDLMALQSNQEYTLMKELDEMEKVNAKLSTAVEDGVDFFCNPERLRNQVKELTARVRALQAS
ncbi:hypothetical protein ACJIZ3_014249 [Penstemon smallii]|uniref:Uncharacterized protein n=1 Tax=Penstemon smallii TaxID=265156 RepID=A0ABD3RQN4_9LAMI